MFDDCVNIISDGVPRRLWKNTEIKILTVPANKNTIKAAAEQSILSDWTLTVL